MARKRTSDPLGDIIKQAENYRGLPYGKAMKEMQQAEKTSPIHNAKLPKVSSKVRKKAQAAQKSAPNQEFGYYNRGQRQSKNVEDATFLSHKTKNNLGS